MFAAIIRTGPDVMPLAATLSVLVEGAAAGLIGHAVIIAPAGAAQGEIGRLADATGADLVPAGADRDGDWRKAAEIARGNWLVLLMSGEVPGQGWVQALERHALTSQGRPGYLPRAGWRGLAARIAPPPRAGAGYVMARPHLLAGSAGRPRVLGVAREG
jgi:hypothetical protein